MKKKSLKFWLITITPALPILGLVSCGKTVDIKNKNKELIMQFISNFNKNQKTRHVHLYVNSFKIDSEFKADELGIKEPENINLEKVQYKVMELFPKEGKVSIQANIEHYKEKESFKFEVNNFKKLNDDDDDEDKIKKEIQEFVDKINDYQTTKFEKKQASSFKEQNKTLADIGVYFFLDKNSETLNIGKFMITLNVEKPNDEAGKLSATLKIEKDNLFLTKKIEISGFLTNNQKDINEAFDHFENEIETTQKEILVDKIEAPYNAKNLGISEPKEAKGIIFEYEIIEKNPTDGSIRIEVKISKNNLFLKKEIKVVGFLTIQEENKAIVEKIKNKIKGKIFKTNLQEELPSNINNDPDLNDKKLGIDLSDFTKLANISLKIISKNDEMGELKIGATIEKGDQKEEIDFKIENYFTVKKLSLKIKGYITSFDEKKPFDLGNYELDLQKTFYQINKIVIDNLNEQLKTKINKMIDWKIGNNDIKIWGTSNINKSFSTNFKFEIKYFIDNQEKTKEFDNVKMFWINIKLSKEEKKLYDCLDKLKDGDAGIENVIRISKEENDWIEENWKDGDELRKDEFIEKFGNQLGITIPQEIALKVKKIVFEKNSKLLKGYSRLSISINISIGSLELSIPIMEIFYKNVWKNAFFQT